MILRLTVRDVETGESRDIEMVAVPESPVGSLLSSLPLPLAGRRCYVGTTALEAQATFAESPLTPGCVVSVGGPGPVVGPAAGNAAGTLKVVDGPDAGLALMLAPGTHTVSRDPSASVCLRDLEVSRKEHARLEISASGVVTVTDRESKNGTFVDGSKVPHKTALRPGSVLRVGSDELRWTPAPQQAVRARRSPDGWLYFNRAFAASPAIRETEVVLPVHQETPRNTALMIPALLMAGGGVVLALVMRRVEFLFFSAVGLLGVLLTLRQENTRRKEREQAFSKGQKAAQSTIAAAVTEEQRIRRRLAPGPAEITETISGTRPDLWGRRADSAHGLVLRVGVADQAATVKLRGEPWQGFEQPTLRKVPVTVDLRVTGVLGVIGPDARVQPLLAWLVIQLAALRAPDDLRIVVLTAGEGDRLAWTRWLPQVNTGPAAVPCWIGNTPQTRADRVQELKELISTRRSERRSSPDASLGQEVVVVLDGALALRDLPGMNDVLRYGPSVDVSVVCADRRSMNECRGLCDVGSSSLQLTRTPDDAPMTAVADGFSADAAERLARALAPMRDRMTLASAQNALPDRIRFLDLLKVGVPTAEDVLTQWGQGAEPRTRVALGADGSGPVFIDLARQGPHTMLGGATGAGKSILLQTLVTSLLLANRPSELNLVLVDFKGGSAFLPFERCPHVVALIRSTGETPADVFDEAAAARVLASTRAEVSRRESVLARYDGEIDKYWQRRAIDPQLPPLPRLVMIFDEFARVLETSPDFVKELVNVAAKGRSLGMHLVLATQSLQGKLSPELKNNISLRISLRQNEPADSVEVLGAPDAATIPGTLRGRGMILCTSDESRVPQVFQSGYLGDPPASGTAAPVIVRTLDWAEAGAPRPIVAADHGDASTDQDLAIAAIEDAGRRTGQAAPFKPLLPPLPATLTLDDLEQDQISALAPTAVPFGLTDEPKNQAQPAEVFDLAGTDRLLLAGGPQSGRTTFARTLITGLATRLRPDQAHLYVIEHHPAGLSDYAGLPHCGGVISSAEPDRIRRLITWLDQETRHRSATSLSPGAEPRPRVVVIIDGWEHFEDHSDPAYTDSALATTIRGIITAGPPVGVHIVAIGGQDMLNHKLPNFYNRRLLLPFPKEETRRIHLNSGVTSPPVLPGRAIDAATGAHSQICLSACSPDELLTRVRNDRREFDPARLPREFPALPTQIISDDLAVPEPLPSATWIPLGVGGPDTTTIGIDLFAGDPHLLLVSGPARSGRTTAALALARSLRRVGIGVLALAPPNSPLPRLLPTDAGTRVLTGYSINDTDLREAAAGFGDDRYAIIMDDADRVTVPATQQGFTDSPTLLDDVAQPSAFGSRALIVTADAAPLLSGFPRPATRLINTILTTGTRLLLTPANRAAALAHSIALEPDQYFTGPPGRGFLSTAQATVQLQIAIPAAEAVSLG